MLEYDRIFWKLLLKGLYLQFLIAISSSLTHCSSVLAYSYSGVLYCTEYQRLCKLTLGICTASNSIKLKCLIGSDCLLFCLSPINSSLVISTLHIGLFSLGEHERSSEMNSFFCYMSENERFSLKWGIGEFIRKNQKWLVNLLVNRSECGFTNIF